MKPLLAALALSTALASPALAFDPANMTEGERTALNEAVKAYILEHPEVLVEAMGVLEDRRMANEAQNDAIMVKANAAEIFADDHSWVGGNPEGDVTLVEFLDYRCTYCRKAFEEVEELVKQDGNIRLVFKEFPILGQESELASRFAVSVQQLDGAEKYKEAHDRLMAMRGAVTLESLKKLAGDMGIDGDRIVTHMNTDPVSDVLRANRQLAEKMRIMGTPTFAIGGAAEAKGEGAPELLRGYVPLEGMQALVAKFRG